MKKWVYTLTHTALKSSSCLCLSLYTHQNLLLPPVEEREGGTGSYMQPDPPEERGCKEHLLCGRRKIKLSAATTFLSPTTSKHHSDTNPLVTASVK